MTRRFNGSSECFEVAQARAEQQALAARYGCETVGSPAMRRPMSTRVSLEVAQARAELQAASAHGLVSSGLAVRGSRSIGGSPGAAMLRRSPGTMAAIPKEARGSTVEWGPLPWYTFENWYSYEWPYSAIGKIYVPNHPVAGKGHGTGVLIGPIHLLTAAHIVFSGPGGTNIAQQGLVRFYPGLRVPFDHPNFDFWSMENWKKIELNVVDAVAHERYQAGDDNYDMAICLLEDRKATTEIGYWGASCGSWQLFDDEFVEMFGYPQSCPPLGCGVQCIQPPDGWTMYWCRKFTEDVTHEQAIMRAGFCSVEGMSGGPVHHPGIYEQNFPEYGYQTVGVLKGMREEDCRSAFYRFDKDGHDLDFLMQYMCDHPSAYAQRAGCPPTIGVAAPFPEPEPPPPPPLGPGDLTLPPVPLASGSPYGVSARQEGASNARVLDSWLRGGCVDCFHRRLRRK